MRRLLFLLAFVTVQANAQIAYLIDGFESHHAPRPLVVTQYWRSGIECYQFMSGGQIAINAMLLAVPIACAVWSDQPECTIIAPTWASDLVLGHEISHCWRHDYHDLFGVPYPYASPDRNRYPS